MGAYITDPTVPRTSLQQGKPAFSWGSFNDQTPPSRAQVTNVALTSDVATLTLTLLEGEIPVVGALITVKGTQTEGGLFNVLNAPLTAVSIDASGEGTVTFALTHANVASAADAGQATIPQPVVGESLEADDTAGQQFSVPVRGDAGDNQHGLSAAAIVTGGPDSYTVDIQGAAIDEDSAYTTVFTISNEVPGTGTQENWSYPFVRATQSGSGGTDPTIAVALSLF